MSAGQHVIPSNRLLNALPLKEREGLFAECTSVDLVLGSTLYE